MLSDTAINPISRLYDQFSTLQVLSVVVYDYSTKDVKHSDIAMFPVFRILHERNFAMYFTRSTEKVNWM